MKKFKNWANDLQLLHKALGKIDKTTRNRRVRIQGEERNSEKYIRLLRLCQLGHLHLLEVASERPRSVTHSLLEVETGLKCKAHCEGPLTKPSPFGKKPKGTTIGTRVNQKETGVYRCCSSASNLLELWNWTEVVPNFWCSRIPNRSKHKSTLKEGNIITTSKSGPQIILQIQCLAHIEKE